MESRELDSSVQEFGNEFSEDDQAYFLMEVAVTLLVTEGFNQEN